MPHRIGSRVPRSEDPGLLTGTASFVDDLAEPRLLHAAVLRSQYGHAELRSVDTAAAEAQDGVVAVLTGEDLEAAGVPGTIPVQFSLLDSDDPDIPTRATKDLAVPPRPIIAREKVRYTGEPVAVVLAEDRYDAHAARDLVEVDYDRLDAITHPREGLEEGAVAIHQDEPDNLAFDWSIGDEARVDEIFEDAPHVVEMRRDHQRLAPNPIEPRGALAVFEAGAERLDVRMGTQAPHLARGMLAHALGLPEGRIRVSAPAVGGGFGLKSKWFPGEALAAWASMETGRPVKWIATRTESFTSDIHGRGFDTRAEMALDDDGTILGMRVSSLKDMGAYVSRAGPVVGTSSYVRLLAGQYTVPAIHCRVKGVFTNTSPTDAYRGSGRPESIFVVERLVHEAARALDLDPVELRRRNLIPDDAFPYKTPVTAVYDSGQYELALDRALECLDYEAVRERRAAARDDGRYLGVGFCCFVEHAGSGPPSGGGPAMSESARIELSPSGAVSADAGTADVGQGHATTYAQIIADRLGVDVGDVEVDQADTDLLPHGTGSFGSRSTVMGGNAIAACADKIVDQGRRLVAHQFEVAEDDVVFEEGAFQVRGVPERRLGLAEVAARAYEGTDLPPDFEPGLEATTFYASEGYTYPFGAHAALVEVHPATGEVDLLEYVAVDDCGVQVNPMIVEGQVVGGTVQGIGAALFEGARYDDTGTLLNGSLQDYTLPRGPAVPDIETDHTETPSPLNRLGVKGTGESGTIGAPAALVNAVLDALEPLGVEHVPMPMTPETVWRAIQDAG